MDRTTHRSDLIAALLCGGVALGALLVPPTLSAPLRSAVRDALVPGRLAVLALAERARAVPLSLPSFQAIPSTRDDKQARAELAAWKELTRQLQLRNAELQEQHDTAATVAYRGTASEPLIVPELLEATVLGTETADQWRAGHLLNRGTSTDVLESALVLEDTRPLIDQGEPQGLRTGQPVFAGKAVVGRIAQVGRWSSTLQPVTDAGYRGLAQIVRQSSQGYVLGAQGKLEGRGEALCRLTHVPATEPVSIGDDVYTGELEATLPGRMYYGKIVRAELPPGATHWDLWIEPAVSVADLRTVQILCKAINPLRLTAAGEGSTNQTGNRPQTALGERGASALRSSAGDGIEPGG